MMKRRDFLLGASAVAASAAVAPVALAGRRVRPDYRLVGVVSDYEITDGDVFFVTYDAGHDVFVATKADDA